MKAAPMPNSSVEGADPFRTRATPAWYKDAKFGIFIHWGPMSVPAWAPGTGMNVQQMMKEKGVTYYFKYNPYAEWYLNTMRVPGSPTQLHHLERWGGAPYDVFGEIFNDQLTPEVGERFAAWADLFSRAGARYVVPVSKHHDGFTLWPTDVPPRKRNWHAKLDLIGMMRERVLEKGMKFGVYYSGLYDWTWNAAGIRNPFTAAVNGRQSPEVVAYMDGHVRELIDRYRPSVLWNDIGYVTHPDSLPYGSPAFKTLTDLWLHYYAAVPDGAIDDRWFEIPARSGVAYGFLKCLTGYFARPDSLWLSGAIDALLKLTDPAYDKPAGGLTFPISSHFDYNTFEYAVPEYIRREKWELVRGIGTSFCYNQNEAPGDRLTFEQLVVMFVDVVSKNGNLLLNVGPKSDGSLQEVEAELLESFGAWMKTFGDALYDSRPWGALDKNAYISLDTADIEPPPAIRFTEKNDTLNVFFRIAPGAEEFLIPRLRPAGASTRVELWLGPGERREVTYNEEQSGMRLTGLHARADGPLQCISISPTPAWNS